MFRTILALMALAVLAIMLTPAKVDAYGAAHVGYTHVGPNGVYHVGETAAVGPGGAYGGERTTAVGYGGARYGEASYGQVRTGYGGASYGEVRTGYGGAAYGGRVYAPSYGAAGYAYVR